MADGRIFGRQVAKRHLAMEEINQVSGGEFSHIGLSPDSICYVPTSDATNGNYEPDDCASDW